VDVEHALAEHLSCRVRRRGRPIDAAVERSDPFMPWSHPDIVPARR
jgi:hypothetical protein